MSDQLVDNNCVSSFWYVYVSSNLFALYSVRIFYTGRNVTGVCAFPQLLPDIDLVIHYRLQDTGNYNVSLADTFMRLLNISQLFNSKQTVQGFPLQVLHFRCKLHRVP